MLCMEACYNPTTHADTLAQRRSTTQAFRTAQIVRPAPPPPPTPFPATSPYSTPPRPTQNGQRHNQASPRPSHPQPPTTLSHATSHRPPHHHPHAPTQPVMVGGVGGGAAAGTCMCSRSRAPWRARGFPTPMSLRGRTGWEQSAMTHVGSRTRGAEAASAGGASRAHIRARQSTARATACTFHGTSLSVKPPTGNFAAQPGRGAALHHGDAILLPREVWATRRQYCATRVVSA